MLAGVRAAAAVDDAKAECIAVITKQNSPICMGNETVLACIANLPTPEDENALTCEEITARYECLGHSHDGHKRYSTGDRNECPKAPDALNCMDLLFGNFKIPE